MNGSGLRPVVNRSCLPVYNTAIAASRRGEYAVGCIVILMCGEEIGHGEDGHAGGFSGLYACFAVFKYDTGFGRDIEVLRRF